MILSKNLALQPVLITPLIANLHVPCKAQMTLMLVGANALSFVLLI